MLTITISARTVLFAALLAVAGVAAFYASNALGSSEAPEQVILGDINCDGAVDTLDALGALRHSAGLEVEQQEPCFEPGSVAAIPGPEGPPGPQGPPGPENVLFASINRDADIQAGDAIDSFIDQFGIYRITFDRNVSQCAATVSPGLSFGGPNPVGFSTVALTHAVQAGQGNDQQIGVSFRDQTQALTTFVQTDFHLIVAC